MRPLKEAAEQVFGAMVLVHTSAAAMRAVEMGEKTDVVSLRLTLERAASDLERAHSTLVDATDTGRAVAASPAQDVLEQRVEEQRQTLWRAAAIVQCVAGTAMDSRNPVNGTLNGNQAKDIEMALMAAHALIYDATGELEADVLLRAPDTAEESQE